MLDEEVLKLDELEFTLDEEGLVLDELDLMLDEEELKLDELELMIDEEELMSGLMGRSIGGSGRAGGETEIFRRVRSRDPVRAPMFRVCGVRQFAALESIVGRVGRRGVAVEGAGHFYWRGGARRVRARDRPAQETAMSLIPLTIDGKIQFFESKTDPWTTNATAIGTTAAAVTALETKVTTAQAKLAAAVAARAAAKAATADLNLAVRDLVTAGSDIIKQIRAKAATDGPNVYVLAQIPAPATPAPVGPPGQPTDFRATLNPDGSLRLTWKCANPAGSVGTIYQVARRVGGGGEFAVVGGSGTKSFDDASVPAGVPSVTYQVVAVRSTAIGTAAQFTVNFGVSTAGQAFATVANAPKLAA